MSDDIKNRVLFVLKNALAGAEDNLYRANMQFGKMSMTELKQEYGQSGKTCGDILNEYQADRDELKMCVTWVEASL